MGRKISITRKLLPFFIIMSFFLVGCGNKKIDGSKTEINKINIGVLNDINSIGLVSSLSSNSQIDGLECEYISYDKAGELAVDLAKGDLNIATLPADLAATLHNKKDGEVKIAAINTLGLYYLMENGNTINTVGDLNNKKIYIIGENNISQAILDIFIQSSKLENIEIVHKANEEEVKEIINNEIGAIAMLSEPLATELDKNNPDIRKVFDMNDEWSSINIGNPLVSSVIVVSSDFAKNNPESINSFLERYKESVFYSRENIDEVAKVIESKNMLPKDTAREILEDSHIVFIEGEEMQLLLDNYFEHINNYNSSLIGGSIPNGEFYYFR